MHTGESKQSYKVCFCSLSFLLNGLSELVKQLCYLSNVATGPRAALWAFNLQGYHNIASQTVIKFHSDRGFSLSSDVQQTRLRKTDISAAANIRGTTSSSVLVPLCLLRSHKLWNTSVCRTSFPRPPNTPNPLQNKTGVGSGGCSPSGWYLPSLPNGLVLIGAWCRHEQKFQLLTTEAKSVGVSWSGEDASLQLLDLFQVICRMSFRNRR